MKKIVNLKAPYLHCFLGAPLIILPIIYGMTSKKYSAHYLAIIYQLVVLNKPLNKVVRKMLIGQTLL